MGAWLRMARVALAHKVTNKWKPAPTFSIGGLEKILDTTFEREEVTTLG